MQLCWGRCCRISFQQERREEFMQNKTHLGVFHLFSDRLSRLLLLLLKFYYKIYVIGKDPD